MSSDFYNSGLKEKQKNSRRIRKIILIFLTFLLAVAAILYFLKYKQIRNSFDGKNLSQENSTGVMAVQKKPEDKIAQSISDKREIFGFVGGIQKPKSGGVVFLTISADIIDNSNLGSVNYNEKTVTLPMVKKTFRVAVDEDTKLINISSLEDIQLNNFIRLVAPQSIYEADSFTAIEAEKQKIQK
ncbi:MAG: hypothetical protein ACD_11C00133G0005 [uncultured bacterium]|nr:MAG: hypothetical protein ACD_11C00133G0005 [uncultured bacterium]HBR71966.1 hypothetical protein [Candidatus Moranbacteria bacterium]